MMFAGWPDSSAVTVSEWAMLEMRMVMNTIVLDFFTVASLKCLERVI
jgi:hypothetical protein